MISKGKERGRRDADRSTDNRTEISEKGYVHRIHQAVFGGLGGGSQEAAGQQGKSEPDIPYSDAKRNQEFKAKGIRGGREQEAVLLIRESCTGATVKEEFDGIFRMGYTESK